MATPAPGQTLAPSQSAAFKELLALYDTRAYAKAVKKADSILKVAPTHGDTIAFKGLFLYNLKKKAEGIELIRDGIKKSQLKSPTCWHILGITMRTEKDYVAAMKAFRSALRLDGTNVNILRDLANVQAHLRDFAGNVETRQVLLSERSNMPTHWLGFAAAHALTGSPEMAASILTQYEATLQPRSFSAETNESVFYRARLAEAVGAPERALSLLTAQGADHLPHHVLDSSGAEEKRAELLLRLGRCDEAAFVYRSLLEGNPENAVFHHGLQCAVLRRADLWSSAGPRRLFGALSAIAAEASASGAPYATPAPALALLLPEYARLAASYPRARLIRVILLELLPAEHPLFTPLLAAGVRGGVRKGIPSLYMELRHLLSEGSIGTEGVAHAARVSRRLSQCSVPPKCAILQDVVRRCYDACSSGGVTSIAALPASPDAASWPGAELPTALLAIGGDGMPELPASLPWAALLHAAILDETGDSRGALAVLDAAAVHTPTVLELYVSKAKYQRHLGDVAAAAETMDSARKLDLADRFLNTKATKYLLRAGRIADAERTISLFVRPDAKRPDVSPLHILKGNQVLWWELECAEAYERARDMGPALKRFLRVQAFFADFEDDAFDFHAYCLRRSTLCAYADMMDHSSFLHGHCQMLRACLGAARCYRAVFSDASLARPRKREGVLFTEAELLSMSKEERKKADLKIKKAEKREAEKKEEARKEAIARGEKPKPALTAEEEEKAAEERDDDPFGDKLLLLPAPLEEARKHIKRATDALPAPFCTAVRAEEEAVAAAAASLAGSGGGAGGEPVGHAPPTPPLRHVDAHASRTLGSSIVGTRIRPGTASREWLVSAALAIDTHVLAGELALAANLPLLAGSHLAAVQRVISAFGAPAVPALFERVAAARTLVRAAPAWGALWSGGGDGLS